MCGLTGFLDPARSSTAVEAHAIAATMADALAHRGPDDRGSWVDPQAGIALGHRRLAIIDLSPEGHQPMISGCGRWVVAFNGEIYNFGDLRGELEEAGCRFHGRSDTEVLLEAVARWGVEEALRRANGMFAVALWDRRERRLWLARDRFGQKPLYYGVSGGVLLFASELKAFAKHPAFRPEIDRDSLALLLRHGCIPAPWTIYRGIRKLPAGTLACFAADRLDSRPQAYWSAWAAAEAAASRPFTGTVEEATEALEALLRDAVRLCMVADVPVGAFLSGGVDSSAVVALMQAESDRPVRSFTIGFEGADYDEAPFAAAVARHLGTEHTELYLTEKDALDTIPLLPSVWDEPFADSSQIPTLLVSRMARRQVKVSLSGDGGDELFAGYNRHFWAPRLERLAAWPLWARRPAAGVMRAVSGGRLGALAAGAGAVLPSRFRPRQITDKLSKLAEAADAPTPEDMYRRLVSLWPDPSRVVRGSAEPPSPFGEGAWRRLPTLTEGMMLADTVGYLPDDVLAKVDRASMSVGLEARVPFLDHRLFEFAWRLPLSMKMRGGAGKLALRRVLDRHVPAKLIDRPKSGFTVPLAAWLRGELRDWAEALLSPERLSRDGFFAPEPVATAWRQHLAGRNHQHALWPILMFQAWLEEGARATPRPPDRPSLHPPATRERC